jgi:RNA polymerase-binding transcription factor DksA
MPNSKKSKSAPAKKHLPAKPAKSAAVKKPAAPHKHPSSPKPAPAKHQPAKPAPAKHHPPKATVPSSSNKPAKKSSHAAEPAKKPAAKPVEPPKAAPKTEVKPAPAHAEKAPHAAKPATPKSSAGKALSKADALRARILERRSAKPIAFTLDEVREIAKVNVANGGTKNGTEGKTVGKPRTAAEELEAKLKKAAQPHHVKAASLADILGYNPAKQAAPTVLNEADIDPKFQRYYKLLIELRQHVASGLDTHTEETLKRSSKDDAGDLSSYAQHMADAGTDTFDRDFALSLVSNEQEALAEIEAAIQRIKTGTYGVCELTGKPISKERLLAVPFARFSVESQTEVERTKRRSASRGGLFGEGEEGGKIEDDGGSDE